MKNIFITLGTLALFMVATTASAAVERVAGDWQLNAPSSVEFTCGGGVYPHTFDTVTMDEDGSFTGTGSADNQSGYHWDVEGLIDGDNISFTIVYTGNNAGYTLNLEGDIVQDGSISGTSDGNCQTFIMPAGAAFAFVGNHGQYVSMQDDKKAAAQSRVGMPSKSKGHTQ